ncbi:MAG: sugar transferase [Clostridiales bacterium]|nr:sugar transferase [Clostridiales bacterium]MBS5877485.1 sugar transferase [Clostridiales bacterium]MDU0938872.1 sugar transferase [Clostridiales bacterium]MDU1041488.1 sugar transferase [Clostridiales bacterium]MDU3490000.1 sugar transferase [Clostridiales bacterium]
MYKKLRNGWGKHLDFVFLDIICAEIAYFLAFTIYLEFDFENPLYRYTAVLIFVSEIINGTISSSFKSVLKRGYLKELGATIFHVFTIWVLVFFLIFLFKLDAGTLFSRMAFLLSFIFHIIFSYWVRILWKRIIVKRLRSSNDRALLLVVDEKNAGRIITTIRKNNFYGLGIVGLIITDKDMIGESVEGVKVVSSIDKAVDYIVHQHIDEVFIKSSHSDLKDFASACTSMGLAVHRPISNIPNTETHVQKLAGYSVLTSAIHMMSTDQIMIKRIFDIIGGLVGSAITCIIFPFIAVSIKSRSKGPVFFRQRRVGQNGKIFYMYKFRSMHTDAEERKAALMSENEMGDDMMFKMEDDPRIIRGIGHFIRKYSIDELPQFFNVLIGDMSLVGTRPPTVEEWKKYLPNHRVRLSVKPGITGMWQVSGRNKITDFEEIVKLDEKYLNKWSYGLDIRIILKTISGIFKGEGK